MEISQKLQNLIKEKNLTQKELSSYIGVSTSTVNNWIKLGRSIPAEYIIPICEFLNISAEYFLTGKEKNPSPELTEEEQKCLEVFDRLEPDDRIRFIAKMEQRYEDYSSEFSEELTPEVKKNVS